MTNLTMNSFHSLLRPNLSFPSGESTPSGLSNKIVVTFLKTSRIPTTSKDLYPVLPTKTDEIQVVSTTTGGTSHRFWNPLQHNELT